MVSKKNLVFQILLVLVGFVGVSAAQEDAPFYTLASIKGTYATVGTYGANLAIALAVRHYDGKGNVPPS